MKMPFRYLSVDEVKQRYHRESVPSVESPSSHHREISALAKDDGMDAGIRNGDGRDGVNLSGDGLSTVGTDGFGMDSAQAEHRVTNPEVTGRSSSPLQPQGQRTPFVSTNSYDPYKDASWKPALSQLSSDTSNQAAAAIEPHRGTLRDRVYRAIRGASHGMTAQQIEELTGLAGSTVRPRIRELIERNEIIQSHQMRKTRAGRNAHTYFAAK